METVMIVVGLFVAYFVPGVVMAYFGMRKEVKNRNIFMRQGSMLR